MQKWYTKTSRRWIFSTRYSRCVEMLRSTVWAGVITTAALTGCASQPAQRTTLDSMPLGERAAQQALQLVGAPYRYGGATPRGFDCSGLVHYSYARAGARVPRTTRGQRAHSRRLSAKHLRAGDLLFFNQEGKRASHVGLYIGKNRFVHAPSSGKSVRLSSLANPYWQRHLLEARRPQL